jgi:hypothetical protein
MTAQDAAQATQSRDKKGVSAAYWRDVERGSGTRRGRRVPVRASARVLAAMAVVVGVRPAELAAANREDAARVLEEIRRRDGVTVPLATAVVPRRDRKLPVLTAEDEEGLQPYLLSVRRQVLAAAGLPFGPGLEDELPEELAEVPGALIFHHEHEVRIWDSDLLSTPEKERLLAVLRRLGAKAEVPSQRDAILTARPVNKASRSA